MSELEQIQHWFTSIIVKPGGLDEKITLADRYYHQSSADVVCATEDLSARERIGIYAGGYMQRLLECMEAEYPALRYLLGEELFGTFVTAYLRHFPSTSPNLYDLSKNFADFLQASQPAHAAGGDTHYGLPVDIARVERAMAEVMTAQGLEGMNKDTAAAPFFVFGAILRTSPCLKLVHTACPVAAFIRMAQRGEAAPIPVKQDSFIAISRRNYIVYMHELERWQWDFLSELQRTGNCPESAAVSAERNSITKDTLLADLILWIPAAISYGYVYED